MLNPAQPRDGATSWLKPFESDAAELEALLATLPPALAAAVQGMPGRHELVELVLDLGRVPEARFANGVHPLSDAHVTADDLAQVVRSLGAFTGDNRAGISGTLHRFSAIRNRNDHVVGLTIRRGRALLGTSTVISDMVESNLSLMLLGPPGVGKTTMLREMARVLANEFNRRVVVVDTSNEIAGDGDVPHPSLGRARRMQVAHPEWQHRVMIEAVENHMPEVIVVDEIGTELEAQAARTIAERGVQLIATAHGQTLENVLFNPTLSDLLGGIESVTLGDDEARRRGTQKTVLERRTRPTFSVLIELHSRDELVVHRDVATTVDALLRGQPVEGELRTRLPDGTVLRHAATPPASGPRPEVPAAPPSRSGGERVPLRVLPYGVSRNRFELAIATSGVPATLARDLSQAEAVVTLRNLYRKRPRVIRDAELQGVPIYVLRSNTVMQMEGCLADLFDLQPRERAATDQPDDARKERRRAQPNGLTNGPIPRDDARNGPAVPPSGAYGRRLRLSLSRDRGRRPW